MKFKNRKDGYVLLFTLIVVLILSVLSISAISLVLNETMQLNKTEARLEAHYKALSGIELARSILQSDSVQELRGIFKGNISANETSSFEVVNQLSPGEHWDDATQTIKNNVKNTVESASCDIAFALLSNTENSEVKIISYGNRNSILKSIVLYLTLPGSPFELPIFDMAVYTDSYLEMIGGAKIQGKAGTNSNEPGAIYLPGGGVEITDTIYVGVDGDTNVNPSPDPDTPWWPIEHPEAVIKRGSIWQNTWLNNHQVESLEEVRQYELPDFPDPPDLINLPDFPTFPDNIPNSGNLNVNGNNTVTVTEGANYNNINVSGSGKLIIDLQGNNLSIRADSLDIGGAGSIEVNGPGVLNMYVDDDVSISGNGVSSLNNSEYNLYVNGDFSSSGNCDVELSNLYTQGFTQLGNSGLIEIENLYINSNESFSTSGNGTVRVLSEALIKATSASFSSGLFDFQNGAIQKFEISNEITFNGNADIQGLSNGTINCNSLNFQQGHMNLSEEGNLEIYVADNFDMGGGSTLNYGGNEDAVELYYAGANELDLTGNMRYTGLLNILQAETNLGGSGKIFGLVISGGPNVNFTGGSSADVMAIYAPNSTVNVSGGAQINGAVVADQFYASGGSRVIYETETGDIFPSDWFGSGDGEIEEQVEIWSR
ncbi:MAG: hypothetical protein ACOC80_05335 [Petrotogales bacterium]